MERYAFLPLGKVKRTLRFPTGGENSPPNGVAFLFCLDFVHLEQEQRDLPRCDVQQRCTSRPLSLLIFRAPYEAPGGWREGPQGNRQGCRFLFAGAGAPSKSPEPDRVPGGRSPEGADSGGPFLWVTFLWASKEK